MPLYFRRSVGQHDEIQDIPVGCDFINNDLSRLLRQHFPLYFLFGVPKHHADGTVLNHDILQKGAFFG